MLLIVFKIGSVPKSLCFFWDNWSGNCEGRYLGLVVDRDSSAATHLSLPLVFLLGCVVQDFLLLRDHEIHHPGAVVIVTVISESEFTELSLRANASASIKGGRVNITVKVSGDKLVLSVAQNAL